MIETATRKEHKCNKNNQVIPIVFIDSINEDTYCISFNGAGWYIDPGEYGIKIYFCPFCGEKL